MRIYRIYLVLIFFSVNVFGQKIILKGSVKDSLNKPLTYANVIAKSASFLGKIQFAITDDEGYYKLVFNQSDTVIISVSYLGYKTINYNFIAKKSTIKNFNLSASTEELDEIIFDSPIKVRGDTIIYNTDKFITGDERKLKNILRKLPGIEVDENGDINVQGIKVTKMLVDGKKFFGGNSKLAVDNIPADAVSAVEVIDNYNEISFLKNLSDTNEMAMNIKLKEDKKSFVFGDIEIGKGNNDFFKTHSNLFYYSSNINVNFIGNINNIGEKTFTYKDYLSFQSNINPVFGRNFNWRGGDFSQFLKDKDVFESGQKFGALNVTKSKDDLNISGFLILSKSNTKNISQTQNNYSTFSEFRENENVSRNLISLGTLNIDYNPVKNEKWFINTELKSNSNNLNNQITSLVNEEETNINTLRDLNAFKINQIFEWHKRHTDNHTSSSVLNYNYQRDNRFSLWKTNDEILESLIPIITNQNILILDQEIKSEKHNFGFIFKHFWEINNSNHLYITLGNNYLKHLFKTRDLQFLDNDNSNNFSIDGFDNNLDFRLNDFFIGLNYKFKTGIFTLNQSLELHDFSWSINQTNFVKRNKIVLLPILSSKIQFNRSKKIQLNYRLRTSFSDASKLANRYYLRSYNSVFRGNEMLANNLFQNASIYYSRFSLYRGLIMNVNLNYIQQLKGAQNTVEFNNVNQFLTVRMFDNPSESVRLRGSVYKKIGNIRYKFDGSASHSNFIQKINNSFQINKNRNYSFSFGLETLYKDLPIIDVGFKRTIGSFISSNIGSKFIINEPFITIDYDFWKGFIFSFDYRSFDFTNKALNQKNSYDVANFTLSYQQENSGWSYKVFSNNFLNTSFKRSYRFTQYLISDTKTFILPQVIMIGIGYNL